MRSILLPMVRRTITMPEHVVRLVGEHAEEGESFSAAVSRLAEHGVRSLSGGSPLPYVGAGDGPEDLAERAEHYLRELVIADET
jgi:hypothetical protein